jgi:hypothetical protein
MVQRMNSADANGGIREGEPPVIPDSRRAAQSDSPPHRSTSRLEEFALAVLLVISFMCITAFIYVETFPMGRLFFLYATHGSWEDRSGWGPVAFSFGLAGIILAFASNISAWHSAQYAIRPLAWLLLFMAAILLLACSEDKLLSLLTAIPFGGVSIAWFRIGKVTKGRPAG